MSITIYELLHIMLDGDAQKIKVYAIDDDGEINIAFEGDGGDMPCWLEDIDIKCLDNVYGDCDYLGIEIDAEDMDCEED